MNPIIEVKNESDTTKTYLTKQLQNVHFHLTLHLKTDFPEEENTKLKDGLDNYLQENGGILYHIRPIKNKTLQLYVVARKDEFDQTAFSNWLLEQIKDFVEGTPSILVLTKP